MLSGGKSLPAFVKLFICDIQQEKRGGQSSLMPESRASPVECA